MSVYHLLVLGSNLACGCCVPMPTQHAIPTESANQ